MIDISVLCQCGTAEITEIILLISNSQNLIQKKNGSKVVGGATRAKAKGSLDEQKKGNTEKLPHSYSGTHKPATAALF